MDAKQILRQQFLQVVENQLKEGDPAEAAQTLSRLIEAGYTEKDAKDLISACVGAELMAIMASNEPFNEERYLGYLADLPDLPE